MKSRKQAFYSTSPNYLAYLLFCSFNQNHVFILFQYLFSKIYELYYI